MAEREHTYNLEIDGVGYMCVVGADGAPAYGTAAIPKVAGDQSGIAEERRDAASWHSGFGFSRALAPNTYHYSSGGIDASRPRQLIMGPLVTTMTALGSVTDFVEIGANFFVCASRYIQKVDTSNDDCETPDNSDYTLGVDFTAGRAISVAVPWDTNAFILFSTTHNARTYSGTTAPTELSSNSIQGVYAAKFWSESSNSYVLARSHTASSDPAVAWIGQGTALDSTSWSSAYDIGDDTKAITGLAGGKTMVWVAKPDGLYYVDGRSGKTPRVIEAFPTDASNGTNLFVDSGGQVWYPSAGGLYRYNPNTGEAWDVTPGRGLANQSPIYGLCTAVAQYKGWFYAAIYNATDSYLMLGREREAGEPGFGPIVWHGALLKVASAQITCLYVLGSTTPPRLYFGYGTTVAYIRLPSKADNPLQDTNYRYAASGSVYFAAENIGGVGNKYNLAGLVVQCKRYNSSTYADIYARLDYGEWQPLGRLQASGRVFVPVPSGDWRFSDLELRFDVTNSSSTTTPEIWGLTYLATQRVYTRDLIQTSVWCSERVLSLMGIKERRRGSELSSHLESLAIASPVTLADYWTGSRRETRVLVQPVRKRLAKYKDKTHDAEWAEAVDLTMVSQSSEAVQVDASTIRKWNTGIKWNSGAKWG